VPGERPIAESEPALEVAGDLDQPSPGPPLRSRWFRPGAPGAGWCRCGIGRYGHPVAESAKPGTSTTCGPGDTARLPAPPTTSNRTGGCRSSAVSNARRRGQDVAAARDARPVEDVGGRLLARDEAFRKLGRGQLGSSTAIPSTATSRRKVGPRPRRNAGRVSGSPRWWPPRDRRPWRNTARLTTTGATSSSGWQWSPASPFRTCCRSRPDCGRGPDARPGRPGDLRAPAGGRALPGGDERPRRLARRTVQHQVMGCIGIIFPPFGG
jgi:hypothetical protein